MRFYRTVTKLFRVSAALLAATVFVAAPASAATVVGPIVSFSAGAFKTNVPTFFNPSTGMYQIGIDGKGFHLKEMEFELNLSGTLDPDPSIAYGAALTNFTALPMIFSLSFAMPMVLPSGANEAKGSIVGGLTDFTGDGVSLLPIFPKAQNSFVSTGGPLTSLGVSVGDPLIAGPGPSGSFHSYGPYSAGYLPGPPGSWTMLHVGLDVSLTGGGDIASLTGFTEIRAVPEPATFASALVLVGLTLGGWTFRRRRAAA